MSDSLEDVCRDCGKTLKAGLFQTGETKVLGASFCEDCVRARTLYCHSCRNPIRPEDFAEGRAVTLLGRRFCEGCLEAAVKRGRESAAADPNRSARTGSPTTLVKALDDAGVDADTVAIRRAYGRYVPPSDADLVVRYLLGNRVQLWLDASEGGFRAIIKGSYKVDDRLKGTVVDKTGKVSYPFQAVVKHARASQRYPGCVLVGAKFEQPSKELQAYIKSKMSGRPVMIPSPSSPGRPASA